MLNTKLNTRLFISKICPPLILLAVFFMPLASAQEDEHAGSEPHEDEATHQKAGLEEAGHEEAGHEEEGSNEIHLTASQRERLDLRVAPAEGGSASSVVQAPATVRFNANRIARVGPLLESKVVEVTRDLGDNVRAGDTVAILESVELGRTKARYLSATARLEAAEAEYRRDEMLAEQQITSEADLLESRAGFHVTRAERDALRAELRLYGLGEEQIDTIDVGGETPLSRYLLTAPMDGVIQRRDAVPGQPLSPQETPIHIVNNERMWVMVDVFEQALPRVAPGQTVQLSVRALPGRTFTGTSDWVSRELDEESRTVQMRAVVENEDGALRAGMFGTASIITGSEQDYALVPVDAVQTLEENQQVVFTPAAEEGAFLATPVETGLESGGMVEIVSGLRPGEPVVFTGAFDLMSALTASGRSAAHNH